MWRQGYWMGTVVCGAVLVSILILALTSANAATVSVHLPVVGEYSAAIAIMAALVFGNGLLIGVLLRSWWALLFSPGLTGLWSLLAILSDPGRSTQASVIELAMIETLIPGTIGVIVGIFAGGLTLEHYRHRRRSGFRPRSR
jgi:hypothetical protein